MFSFSDIIYYKILVPTEVTNNLRIQPFLEIQSIIEIIIITQPIFLLVSFRNRKT